MTTDERERLRRAQACNRGELTAIYDEFHQPIYRYIYRQVNHVDLANDLTAEVFQRFLQAIQKGAGPDQNLKAWLFRAAHNIVIDHYRRQQHRQHLPLHEQLVDDADEPPRLAEDQMEAEKVRDALQNLTPDQQQVISLKFLGGLSNKEVATVMKKPVGAVKSLQHRALAALQRQLLPAEETVLT